MNIKKINKIILAFFCLCSCISYCGKNSTDICIFLDGYQGDYSQELNTLERLKIPGAVTKTLIVALGQKVDVVIVEGLI